MKIYVARHAETNYNVLGLSNDSPDVDVHLTAKGVKQAGELSKKLSSVDFELIITSEFPRTIHTADIVNKLHNVPMEVDKRINDTLTGHEGRPSSEYRAARARAQNQWTVKFNGGESFEDEMKRVRSFLGDLKNRSESSILVVTHQVIAQMMYASMHNIPNERVAEKEVNNTTCFELEL